MMIPTTPVLTETDPIAPLDAPGIAPDAPATQAQYAIPQEGDTQGWKTLYRQLGQPETAQEYTLPQPPAGEGDAQLQEWFRQTAHSAGLSARQATQMAAEWERYVQQQHDAHGASHQLQSQEALYALQKEWGPAFDDQIAHAKRAVSHYGLSSDVLDGMETAMGTRQMLSLCARLGSSVQEPAFIGSPKGTVSSSGGASAKETIGQLTKDTQFMAKYLNGDKASLAQMQQKMQEAYAGA